MVHKHFTYLLLSIIAFLLCVLLISFMGCGTMSCPRLDTGQIRILRTVLVVDSFTDGGGAIDIDENTQAYVRPEETGYGNKFILKCGQQWFEQTGIKIEIVETIKITKWYESNAEDAVKELQKLVSHIDPSSYDIAVGMGMSLSSTIGAASAVFIPMPLWAGAIEDEYRRYIRLKTTDCWIFQHELAHAFVFGTLHSGGLLSAFTVFSTTSTCLLEDDFDEVMENKFRDFNIPVVAPKR
ncbi:MAG TPA: hypothetical protein ENH07_10210 [Nitrospirae bacterium]|nr:hypothetical protein [Nitrospirota bacterium]